MGCRIWRRWQVVTGGQSTCSNPVDDLRSVGRPFAEGCVPREYLGSIPPRPPASKPLDRDPCHKHHEKLNPKEWNVKRFSTNVINQAQTAPLGRAVVAQVLKFEDIPRRPTPTQLKRGEFHVLANMWDTRNDKKKQPKQEIRGNCRTNATRTEKLMPTFEPLCLTLRERKNKNTGKVSKDGRTLPAAPPELPREHV